MAKSHLTPAGSIAKVLLNTCDIKPSYSLLLLAQSFLVMIFDLIDDDGRGRRLELLFFYIHRYDLKD
jgi:hypothetical protein